MLESFRKFLESGAGKGIAAVLVLIGLIAAFFSMRGVLTSEAEETSATRMFIDADTKEHFRHKMKMGEPLPVESPSGKKNGYPAEACYWTKDGKPKTEPTWVFVPGVWKGTKEPTFCPDCGRLVVGHNPPASADRSPPPTKEEYEKNPRHSSPGRS